MNNHEKELIRQGLDSLILQTEHAVEYGVLSLKQYRESELETIKQLRNKIMENKIIILD